MFYDVMIFLRACMCWLLEAFISKVTSRGVEGKINCYSGNQYERKKKKKKRDSHVNGMLDKIP